MDRIIVFGAEWLPLLAPATLLLLWLRLPRPGKADLGLMMLGAIGLTAALVLLAGLIYQDPRPFVVDPTQPALFSHGADNGFPSDHTAYAATAALLVATLRRRLGLLLVLLTTAAGLARVAAHLHHIPDVVAGLIIAAVAVAVTTAAATAIRRHRRRPSGDSQSRHNRDTRSPLTPPRRQTPHERSHRA